MKRSFLFVCLLLTIFGCNSYTGSPKEQLLKFLTAMQNSNLAEAKKYATDESQSLLDLISLNGTVNVFKDKPFNILKINVTGGDARAKVDFPPFTSISFHLQNQHGEWKVNYNMSDVMEMANDVLKKEGIDIQKDIDNAIDSARDNDDKDDDDTSH